MPEPAFKSRGVDHEECEDHEEDEEILRPIGSPFFPGGRAIPTLIELPFRLFMPLRFFVSFVPFVLNKSSPLKNLG